MVRREVYLGVGVDVARVVDCGKYSGLGCLCVEHDPKLPVETLVQRVRSSTIQTPPRQKVGAIALE